VFVLLSLPYQACAGIFAALALIISIASTSNDSKTSALGYFGVAVLVVVICLLTFFVLLRLVSVLVCCVCVLVKCVCVGQSFVRYYLDKTSMGVQASQERNERQYSTNASVQQKPVFYVLFGKFFCCFLCV